MAQPTPFSRSNDYSDDSANSVGGRDTVDCTALDGEFDDVATTLSQILTNLALIQRDDGDIRDGEVKLHTLAADVLALVTAAGATYQGSWVTATAYAVGDVVTESDATYLCGTAHTSGTFSTDLAAEKWVLIANAPDAFAADAISVTPAGNIAATDAQAALEELDSEKLAKASNLSDVATPATALSNLGGVPLAGGTMTGLLVLSAAPSADLGAATKGYVDDAVEGLSFGQCYLDYVSPTQVKLSRYNGKKLFIDGAWNDIPSAGVTLPNGSLSATTVYYIYAYMSGSTMTLVASTTARAADSTYGHQIENGDSTRTLVGMVYTDASAQFYQASNRLYVLSWFNRRNRLCRGPFTTSRTFTGTSPAQINAETLVKFLAWSDDMPLCSFDARVSNSTAAQQVLVYPYLNGSSIGGPFGGHAAADNYQLSAASSRLVDGLAEAAIHELTIYGSVSANTGKAHNGQTAVCLRG